MWIRGCVGLRSSAQPTCWTQKELANQINTSYAQLNKYEGGQNTPPLDRLVLLAEVLNTTTDFLITGNLSEEMPIYNTRLIQRLQEIEGFEPEERETVIKVLDAMMSIRALTQGTPYPMITSPSSYFRINNAIKNTDIIIIKIERGAIHDPDIITTNAVVIIIDTSEAMQEKDNSFLSK